MEQFIIDELEDARVGFKRIPSRIEGGAPTARIFAVSWIFEVSLSIGRDRLLITNAWQSRPVEIEGQREAGFRPELSFSFGNNLDRLASSIIIEQLFLSIDAYEAEARDRAVLAQHERIFRVWYAFLRAKADFEAKRENAVMYIEYTQNEATVNLITEIPASMEILGQSRIIRLTTGGFVFCDVVDVNPQEVVVVVTAGDTSRIPRRGRLEVNSVAAEKSIERQRRALDAVNFDRAASTRLRNIIIDPSSSRPPIAVSAAEQIGGGPFDPEKIEVLNRALGTVDVLAIQGPPGTGKTRLIEEILVQYIDRNPQHRVLLSAQTHVALDNVIDRLRARQPGLDMVRIGRLDDRKISPSCRDLVLDRKAHAWSQSVIARANEFMAKWAESRGIDHSSIQIGMLVERLSLLLQKSEELRASLRKADAQERQLEARSEAKLAETGSAELPELDSATIEAQDAGNAIRQAFRRISAEIDEVRQRLEAFGGYGLELATQRDFTELRDWSVLLLGAGEEMQRCRELLELQEEWTLRVGNSSEFHAAMLASAQVVAGTCIGMASVKGMGEIAYDLCIVDEASKATATEILVPMSRGRKWILVGDPEQLPPFFEDETVTLEDFEEPEVRQTLLDIFLKGLPQHSVALLSNQYRMVKAIGDLISEVFYKGALKSPKVKPDVVLTGIFNKAVT